MEVHFYGNQVGLAACKFASFGMYYGYVTRAFTESIELRWFEILCVLSIPA